METILKERFDGLKTIVERSAGGKTVVKFSGPFQEMSDIVKRKNRNGRNYTSELWKRAIKDEGVQDRLKNRRMLGELDHPTDEGQIRRTSHIVTKVEPNFETGIVEGELELLNHDQGDAALLKALVDQGVQLCVSSRGFGDYLEDGCTIDPETYKLVTWDVVLDPSVSIAQLNQVAESVGIKHKYLESSKLPTDKPEEKKENQEQTNQKLIQEKKIMEQEMKELLKENTDLKVAQATTVANLGSFKEKLEEKNTLVASLEKANTTLREKLEDITKDADIAAGMLERLSAENKALKNEVKTLKAEITEATKLGDEAAEVINTLTAKTEAMEKTGTEAAAVIEKLLAKVNEAPEASPEKDDTEKGADGKDKAKGEAEGEAPAEEPKEEPATEGEDNGEEEEGEGDMEFGDTDENSDNDEDDKPAEEPKTEGLTPKADMMNLLESALVGKKVK